MSGLWTDPPLWVSADAQLGPRLGVPQMIQSRAQFGYYGALLVVLVAVAMYVGFFASNLVLGGQSINQLARPDWLVKWGRGPVTQWARRTWPGPLGVKMAFWLECPFLLGILGMGWAHTSGQGGSGTHRA